MARKRSGRRGGKAGVGATLGLVLFLLVCVAVLFAIVFFRQKESLMVLSNKTIYVCDGLMKDLGYDVESAELTVQQVNYDRTRPYTYLYRRIPTTNDPAGIRDLKRGFQRILSSVDQFRRVRILRFSETKEDGRILWSFKLGMSKLVFYNLEFAGALRPGPAAETDVAGEEYAGFEGEAGFEGPETVSRRTQEGRKVLPKVRARIAVIIDDVGSEHDSLTRKFLSFPGELTFAVFPGLDATADRAERINRIRRFDIIVHQPMEPENRKEMVKSLLESEIYTDMSGPEIAKVLDASLNSVKYARGMNNHQGSRATSDLAAMEAVIRHLKAKGIFFVDSFTAASSVGYKVADRLGVPWRKRDIFLDNENRREYVQKQLDRLVAVALKKGSAVGIGHMNREATIDVLLANYRKLREQGVEFVLVRDLLVR
jgi:polysaccharide deacetylase 2 family uncharacterized protein YibQ